MVDGTLRLSFERHARRSFAIKRQKRCHQKAKVSPLDLTMSKSPKRPSSTGTSQRIIRWLRRNYAKARSELANKIMGLGEQRKKSIAPVEAAAEVAVPAKGRRTKKAA